MQGPPPPPKEWRLRLLPKDDPEDAWLTNDGVRFTNSIWYHTGGDGIKESPLDRLQLDKTEIFQVPPGHRAYPGRGLRVRAGCVLEEDTDLGYYAGIFRPGIFAPDNPYAFGVGPSDLDLVIDAARVGNETRFINDCYNMPGVEVNLEALDQEIAHTRLVIRTVVFRTLRRIEAGEELFFKYQASAQGYWPTPEIIDLTHDPQTEMTRVKRERSDSAESEPTVAPMERETSPPKRLMACVCKKDHADPNGPCEEYHILNVITDKEPIEVPATYAQYFPATGEFVEAPSKTRVHRCPADHDHQIGPRHCKDCGRIIQTPCRKCNLWYSAPSIAQHEKSCQNRGKRA